MGQKSGNKKNEVTFIYATRLMFKKKKIGKSGYYNNGIIRIISSLATAMGHTMKNVKTFIQSYGDISSR